MPQSNLRPTRLAALTLTGLLLACAPAEPPSRPAVTTAPEKEFGDVIQSLTSDNGMSVNGMSMNGMSMNGMSMNGLTAATLSGTAFKTWFNLLPALNDPIMKYVVRCAAPAGKSYSFYSSVTRRTYTWYGNLGVAPGWVGGAAITTAEQQLVSACLAAHVNKYGVEMGIAVEGLDARGVPLPVGAWELWDFDAREACWFGNLFTGEGIYSGIDHDFNWDSSMSSARACAFDTRSIGTTRDCPPIKMAGYCSQMCTPTADGLGYVSCTYGGKTFKALATRINSWDISTCGDGWCDPQERSGNGWTWDACSWDCGY